MNTPLVYPVPEHITLRPLHLAEEGDAVLLTLRGYPTWGVVLCAGDAPGTVCVDLHDRGVSAVPVDTSTGRAVLP